MKYPLFLLDFNETNFLERISKNCQVTISWKSVLWESRFSIQTNGQTWQRW